MAEAEIMIKEVKTQAMNKEEEHAESIAERQEAIGLSNGLRPMPPAPLGS